MTSVLVAAATAAGLAACGSSDNPAGAVGGAGSGGAGTAGHSGAASGGSAGNVASGGSAGHVASGGSAGRAGGGGSSVAGEGGTSTIGGGGASAGGDASAGAGGEAGEVEPPLAQGVLDLLKLQSPLPALPADTTNKYADDAGARALGQKLFFDKRYSGALAVASDLGAIGDAGKVACVSCHSSPYLADARSVPNDVSTGTNFHTRNAPALVNSSFYQWTNWAGRFSAQWELPPAVAENGITMASSRLKIAHFLYDHYKTEYNAVFTTDPLDADLDPTAVNHARFPADGKPKAAGAANGDWEAMQDADRTIINRIFANFGKALEAYTRQLVSRDAPFDQFIAGTGALSNAEKRGAALFVGKARCSECHSGPNFSDNLFHNLGVPQTGANVPASDDGRFKDGAALFSSAINSASVYSDDVTTGRLAGVTNPMPAASHAQFRTASLREVADTGPYMHSGQFASLGDVVSFYNDGGGTAQTGSTKDPLLVPLALSESEQLDLVAFLQTLSGAAIPTALVIDTSGQ